MGRSARLAWERDGSPFKLIRPAQDLQDVLRRHGYTVYNIGNQSHLEHDPPEDHTPYSATGWPGKAKYGRGYALDVMPPKGRKSQVDGLPLPSLQQLGAQLLADRNAGVAGIKWLKYMNWEPQRDDGGPCYQESWKPAYSRRASTDRGHIHLSALTGFEDSTVGAGYDPVARIRGEGDSEMTEAEVERAVLAALKKAGTVALQSNPKVGVVQSSTSTSVVGALSSGQFYALAARNAGMEATLTIRGLESVVSALAAVIRAGGGSVDTSAILAGTQQQVTAAVRALSSEVRDAVADLGEGGAEQVRGPQG